MDYAALIAFTGLIAGQFVAVVAVNAMRRDGVAHTAGQPSPAAAERPSLPARPARSPVGFATHFAENLDAEMARIDLTRLSRIGVGVPRGLGGPVLAALMKTVAERRRARLMSRQAPADDGVSTVSARGISV